MLHTVFSAVLNMSITASIVILVVILARLFLKRAPKIFSYALWAVVLFRLLSPVSLTAEFSLLGIFETPVTETGRVEYVQVSTADRETPTITVTTPAPTVEQTDPPVQTMPTVPTAPGADPQPDHSAAVSASLVSIVWLCGVVGMLLFNVAQLLRLRRKLTAAMPLRENIYLADHIATPFVVGLLRPKIYLPSALNEPERSYIILHEQRHICRGDHVVKLVAFAALCVHWFNPLVWLAFALGNKDMEMSCDEAVMKRVDKDIRADYSTLLLQFSTGKRMVIGTPLAFGEGDTKGRIKNIMKYKKPMLWIVVLALLACAAVITACALNPQDKDDPLEDHTGEDPQTEETESFEDIMGFSGCWTQEETSPFFYRRAYYADTAQGTVKIAESFGHVIDDHICDLDGDGITELICNVTYGSGGNGEIHVYRLRDGVVERGCLDWASVAPQFEPWGAGAVWSEYDAVTKQFVIHFEQSDKTTFTHEQDDYANFKWEKYPENSGQAVDEVEIEKTIRNYQSSIFQMNGTLTIDSIERRGEYAYAVAQYDRTEGQGSAYLFILAKTDTGWLVAERLWCELPISAGVDLCKTTHADQTILFGAVNDQLWFDLNGAPEKVNFTEIRASFTDGSEAYTSVENHSSFMIIAEGELDVQDVIFKSGDTILARLSELPFSDPIGNLNLTGSIHNYGDTDNAKAGIIERMTSVTAKEIKYLSSTFSNVASVELAAALNGAAEHQIGEPSDFRGYYDLTAYLSGGPEEGYTSDDERFILYAGLEENMVRVLYFNREGESWSGYFSDETLYWLVRNNYHTEKTIDEEAYSAYRDAIEARAQESVDTAVDMRGEPAFTGYEITHFVHESTFETNTGRYTVYSWDAAFTTDDPDSVVWAGGMYLDAEGRVRSYEQDTYFVVKTDDSGEQDYRFLPWSLYCGDEGEQTARESVMVTIVRAFEDSGN